MKTTETGAASAGQPAAAEPYATNWETTVTAVDGRAVRLAETYFYAEGGGQPADRGRIDGVPVTDVQKEAGGHVHYLEETPSIRVGQTVLCTVDWACRMYCMRAHTASHAVYGAGRRLFDDLGYGGFDIAAPEVDDAGAVSGGKVRIDVRTADDVDDDALVELERLVNRVVWESRPVSWETITAEEARRRDEVAFNTKTEEGVFEDGAGVRIVTIEGDREPWDVAACGGTHVRNTREIGPVTLLGRSNPGEGLTRIEFVVGPPGIDHRAEEKRALLSASSTLDAAPTDLADAARRYRKEREDLRDEVADLQRRLVEAEIASATTFEREGATWIAETVEGVGPNDVQSVVQSTAGERADVVVLVGEDGGTFVVAGTTGDPGAGDVVGTVTDEFGGGGGGSPTFAQGGGIAADPAEVVAFLRE